MAESGGGAQGDALPAPDVTDATPVNLSASSGKVALVRQATSLGCNGGSTPCSDTQRAQVADLVGYGSANFFEGSDAAPGASNTSAVLREGAGCVDTDDNAADFTAGTPQPRTTADPAHACDGSGGGTGRQARIHEIQGAAHVSPLADVAVADVPGVVTATSDNGFWFQDPQPDDDPATSEGLFVFTSSAPTAQVGDAVTVSGRVSEFRPGGAAENLTTTEITRPSVTVTSSGDPLPPATVVGPGGRVPPSTVIEDDATGNVETSGELDPAADGLDFDESLEGMRVTVADAVAVGPTSGFGEIPVVPDGAASVRTGRGGVLLRPQDTNPERVILDDALAGTPTVDTGDQLGGVTGVMDYSFGDYKLLVTSTPSVTSGGLTRETTAASGADQLSVATFNVENLDAQDPQSTFDALAGLVVDHLRSPDLLSLEEVQDDDGATDDGTVDATQTVARLTDAIAAAGGPAYEYRDVDPANGQDGGEPGGNIRVGFLFRTDRGLHFVDRPGGDATTATTVEPGPHLSVSPGRVDPTNPAFDHSRKPLAGEFTFRGRPLFVVGNHFDSKGGDDPLEGRFQPPQRPSEDQRRAQASAVHGFVSDLLAAAPDADVVVLGDLNDFPWSEAVRTLDSGVLHNLADDLPADERYSYVYEGNSQQLDHVLVSPHLVSSAAPAYDVVHVNAEFADQASDHDPSVARLTLDGAPDVTVDWGDGQTHTFTDVTSPFTPTHTYAHAGPHAISVRVSDDDGADTGSATLVTDYAVAGDGLLPPLHRDRTWHGRALPVSVLLRDCDGSGAGGLHPRVTATRLVDGQPAGQETVRSITGREGTDMRAARRSGLYALVLDTRAFSHRSGTYRVTVTVPQTGQQVSAVVRLSRA